MPQLHGKNFVADRLSDGTGRTFRAVSPMDNIAMEPPFFLVGENDVDAALNAAESAFHIYRRAAPEQRAAFLEAIADEIMALGTDLIDRASRETGLPPDRIAGERGRTMQQLRLFAQVAREGSWVDARIDTAIPDRQPIPKADIRRMLAPLGPIVVFGSSNFPLAFSVAGGDTASALATGNTVVVKAHRGHPGTSELVASAVRKAVVACNLPEGVFSMLHAEGASGGVALVKHPLTRAVGFTGSRSGGRALFDAAAARPDPIPVFAEMSSLNPVFLLPQALADRATQIAEGLKQSFTLGVGQFCTKPGLVFGVKSPAWEQFKNAFAAQVQSSVPATMLHGGICKSFHEILGRVADVPGVQLLARSAQVPDAMRTEGAPAVLIADIANFLRQSTLMSEVFGPFTLLVEAESLSELEDAARSLEGQLTATVHMGSTEATAAAVLLDILHGKAGRLVCNGFPTGVEVCPSMNHGGPYPATSDSRFTSVGTAALQRFVRPVCYQSFPPDMLPPELHDANPRAIWRLVNNQWTQAPVA